MNAPMIHEPLTKLQCCPTSDGAAATVLCSQSFLDARPELKDQAILIAGQRLATDTPSLFNRSAIELIGYSMSELAAREALAEAKVSPHDVRVCELHELIRAGGITYGGKVVINPSGGLISKGHPLGATGLAQCAELVWHMRGWANNRSVPDTKVALQHNLGLGGAVVVTVYKRHDGSAATDKSNEEIGKLNGLGYNPAVVAKGFTREQVDAVRSKRARSEWALQDTEKKVEARF
jgi:sterol carrier protein 2